MTVCAALCLYATAWLSAHGYGPAQQHAVIAESRTESNLDPRAVSRSGLHFGLLQWRRGARVDALMRYAARRGRPWFDATVQLEFMDAEWRGRPASRAFFATLDPVLARRIFCHSFLVARRCK